MNKCIILCAGGFDGLLAAPEEGDYIIAADGGYRHALTLGLTPDCILGDFDSLGFVPEGANVFPVEKDDTDAMLAVRQGLKLGFDTFYIYGGMEGDRVDHTVANLQTLFYLTAHGASGYLVGKKQIATVLQNSTLCLPARDSGTVSVFALGGDARGVTIKGLHYEAENITLSPAFPLGVSNHLAGKDAKITVENGTLLVIYDKEVL
jgi:thiamine pyrophosphokinase